LGIVACKKLSSTTNPGTMPSLSNAGNYFDFCWRNNFESGEFVEKLEHASLECDFFNAWNCVVSDLVGSAICTKQYFWQFYSPDLSWFLPQINLRRLVFWTFNCRNCRNLESI